MTVAISDPLDTFGVDLPPAPYPGLRPFEKHEWPIFFGRERMIDETIERLVRRQCIVVHGDSGCGKSSLIKAGVFARLEQEYARGGVAWRTCEMQPRVAPLETLAVALAALDGRAGDRQRIVEIRRALNFGAEAPRRVADLILQDRRDHVCLLIDQFEELFALARRGGRDDATLFVQFLVSLVKEPPPGLCAVTTMRSEFLGACAQFPGFAETVNEVQYLLPRMARLDLVRAIREPAPAYNGYVSKDLAQRLVADAGATQDELPLIQHGLMVLYQRKVPPEVRADVPPWRLELADYTSTSLTLAELLSRHADEVAAQAEPGEGRVVQRMFRALTEINADGQAIRRPQSLRALVRVTAADERTLVEQIVKPFRVEGASFLRPYGEGTIGLDDIVDISHEALIRSWRRIADPTNGWLAREFQDGLIWKSLLVQAEIFERDSSNVLSPATALERERWLHLHNPAWAERYGGGWERVKRLVDGSVETAHRNEKAVRSAAKRQIILIASVALLLFVFLAYSLNQNRQTREALDQAYDATAASLWNRLDFSGTRATEDELNALWEITVGSPDAREAFLRQLSSDGERAARFGRRPSPVARAVGLQWPPDRAAGAFAFVVSQPGGLDPTQLTRLGLAAYTLAGLMTPTEAGAALPATLEAFTNESDPNRAAALAYALQGLAPQLSADHANDALSAVIGRIPAVSGGTSSVISSRHALAGAALARRVTPDQARSALRALVQIPSERTSSGDSMIDPLVSRVAPEHLRDQFVMAVERLRGAKTPGELTSLAKVGRRTAERLSEADARAVFPQWFGGFQADVATARAGEWALAGTGLVPRLSGEQLKTLVVAVADAGGTVVDDIDDMLTAAARQAIKTLPLEDVRTIARRIPPSVFEPEPGNIFHIHIGMHGTARERAIAMQLALDVMGNRTAPEDLADLAAQVQMMVAKVDGPQALEPLLQALAFIAGSTDSNQTVALATAARALTARLTPAQTPPALRATFSTITDTVAAGQPYLRESAGILIEKSSNAQRQQALAEARAVLAAVRDDDREASATAAALAYEYLADSVPAEQIAPILFTFPRQFRLAQSTGSSADYLANAVMALGRRLPAADADHVFERTFMIDTENSDEAAGFAVMALSVSGRVSDSHGKAASARFLDAIAKPNSPPRLLLFTGSIARHLTPADTYRLFGLTLSAMRTTTGVRALGILGSAAEALAQRLTPEQAHDALQTVLAAPALRSPDALAQTVTQRRATGEQSAALFTAGRALLGRVTAADALSFAPALLRAIAASAVASNEARASAAITAIMQGWPEDRTRHTLHKLIAWSGGVPETARWMTKLTALPQPQSRAGAVAAVVELLKYPSVAGSPSEQLLDALKKLDPNAPGKDAGLAANLQWVAEAYPAIDPEARPACPDPPAASLACPAPRR